MAEIVNLRAARKQKLRSEKEKAADANRVLHGRSKAERLASKAEREKRDAAHDAHRIDRAPETGGKAPEP
ncbi:DUF4169 family protein [Mesorhizobium sp. CAU 1732]|uniref:DUF4169 family protein n=1 Tax=Mesorhizobium sp. CAU 1732 TaxID=3140358 RepID=UPI0032617592